MDTQHNPFLAFSKCVIPVSISPFFLLTEHSFYLEQHDIQLKDDFLSFLQLAVPSDMYLQDFAWEF